MTELHLARVSDASDPGSTVAVAAGPAWTAVLDADDADLAVKFILQNNSNTAIEVAFADTATAGIILAASGGIFQEDRYAGAVYARHGSTGTKNLTRLIF